jgi:hypothetical protein
MFIVFYKSQGQEYSAAFDNIKRARAFARFVGGRLESRLSSIFDKPFAVKA